MIRVGKSGGASSGGGMTPAQSSKLSGVQYNATKNLADDVLLGRENHTGTQGMATVEGLGATLDSKVDKVAGKGLSDSNYTQAEKDKLAGLESSHFKGQYASLADLESAIPIGEAGDYANVDLGSGNDVVRYIWDTSDSAWSQQLGVSSQLTAAQIKQEYESNQDTNAFSDDEKQKLATAVESTDSRLSDAREWTATTASQAEAEAGTATTRRAWTSQRVRQAVGAWWQGVTSTLGRTLVGRTTAAAMRGDLGLGTGATANVTTSATDTTAGRLLKVGDSPSILLFDPMRKAVESESGGKQTVIYTAKGQPCIMNVIPRFLMEDLPGWDIADGTGTHPAFIFNGVVASEIFVGAYQASEVAGEAISQPMAYPRVDINYDQARALCQANGAGWDMMSNWDWAAVALWCMANGFQPRGNTNYGRRYDSRHETGRVPAGATIGSDATGITNTLTGSGPNTWRHDNSPSGISDLTGNVWEWQTGFKIVDNIAHIQPDNAEVAEASYLNTGYALGGAGTFATRPNAGAPDILKQALIVPNGAADPTGYFYIAATGERIPVRGGSRINTGHGGLGALILSYVRTHAGSTIGFRPRFRNL